MTYQLVPAPLQTVTPSPSRSSGADSGVRYETRFFTSSGDKAQYEYKREQQGFLVFFNNPQADNLGRFTYDITLEKK